MSAHVKGLVKVMFETFPQWEQFVSASVASAARRSAEEEAALAAQRAALVPFP